MSRDLARRLAATVCSMALASCAVRAPHAAESGALAVRPLFGPVIGSEVIAGRAEDLDARAPIVLLVGDQTLVTIDLASRGARRHSIQATDGSSFWGLARLRDGSLWTLKGRRVLARVQETGAIAEEIPLAQ